MIVTVLLAVPNVRPAEVRSVIVTVAVAALSPRICHATACVPPAATDATDWVATVGLLSRSALVGVKLTTTVRPLAADPPPLVTVAVAVNDWPRTSVAGTPLRAIDMPVGGGEVVGGGGGGAAPAVTVMVADLVTAPANAVSVTDVFAETGDVVTVKLACVCPAGTVTIGGTFATAGLPVARVTITPPLGAAEVNDTVPVALDPPVTLLGATDIDASVGAFAPAARLTNAERVTPPALASTSTVVKLG